jgi:hypothetical protein
VRVAKNAASALFSPLAVQLLGEENFLITTRFSSPPPVLLSATFT